MRISLHLAICLALAATPVASEALAAAPNFVAESARAVSGGRTVEVLVAQSEIKSDINPSNIAVATGGGLLGGLLAASQNASRTKKAEAAIEPIRAALAGFDADALALETTKSALAATPWVQPAALTQGKDSSLLGKSAFLDSSGTSQTMFVEYSYDVSPDFSSIRVVAKIQFANKAVPAASQAKPESRLSPQNLVYAQSVTSVVSLAAPSKDIEANAAQWSADGAKAARSALTGAFAQIQLLLPRTLALTAEDIKSMNGKDKKRAVAGGFQGRTQESSPTGTLLWGEGFIQAQTLS